MTLPPPALVSAADFAWDDIPSLDRLRQLGDAEADACAAELKVQGVNASDTRRIFATLRKTGALPADTPLSLRTFLERPPGGPPHATNPALPAWADLEQIERGQHAFMTQSIMSLVVMLCRSLPEGYAAPSMSRVLNLSGQLQKYPFHRLMGTLQLLRDVSTPGSFRVDGVGAMLAQEMRLLHAGVRTNVAPESMRDFPAFRAQYGVPINQEDMLGTVLGFSMLVIEGLERMGVPMSPRDADDFYHTWRVFGFIMGVRRPGLEYGADAMPTTLADARTFYAKYRRHYVDAAHNPDGVALAAAHVQMLVNLMPTVLQKSMSDLVTREGESGVLPIARKLLRVVAKPYLANRGGAGELLARSYIRMLTDDATCRRVGLEPPAIHLEPMLIAIAYLWEQGTSRLGGNTEVRASGWIFGKLIDTTYHEVRYTVPLTLDDVVDLVHEGRKTHDEMGLLAQRKSVQSKQPPPGARS